MKNRIKCGFYLLFLSFSLPSLFLQGEEAFKEGKEMPPSKQVSESSHCPTLTGRVITRDDPGYEEARLVSNFYPSKQKFPDTIVYCQRVEDVQNAVKWARCHQKNIRIRSGGHNHEAFSTGTGSLVIDVSEMKQLQIDKDKRIATVQPGLTGGELYRKLYDIGLTQVGGTCSDVGISGLILTGGMGPLYRKHGLACDSLLKLELVDVNGNLIQATKDNEHKDLFWASCGGGGGNFGIVTSLTLQVYPAESVTWFNIGWDWNQPIDKIFSTWQDFFSKADDRWFSHIDIWSKAFPAATFKKQPVKVMGIFWGTPEEAAKELAPFLNIGHPNDQTIEFVTWNKAIKAFEEATSVFITDKPEYKSTGAFAMKPFPEEAIHTITTTLKETKAPLFNVLLFSLGGDIKKMAPNDTAYFYRQADFFVSYSIQWLHANEDIQQIGEVDTLRNNLLPYTQGDYIGNPDRNLKDYLNTYYGENVHKLRCIKRQYDPSGIFRFEQSIPPAPADWNCTKDKKI